MSLDTVNRQRRLAGRAAALCCLLFLLAAGDGLVAGFRQTASDLRLLGGGSEPVDGAASEGVRSPQDLQYTSSSDLIRVSFEELDTGFWLGGLRWRGILSTSPDITAGDYDVTVTAKSEPSGKPLTVFHVRIFSSALSLQESSASQIQRYTGISPWWPVALFFLMAVSFSGIVYLCSQKREQLLRQEGKAEIYRISNIDGEWEVSFALGTEQGVRTGSVLTLLDRNAVPVGSVTVRDAYEGDATAIVSSGCQAEPGFMVAIP